MHIRSIRVTTALLFAASIPACTPDGSGPGSTGADGSTAAGDPGGGDVPTTAGDGPTTGDPSTGDPSTGGSADPSTGGDLPGADITTIQIINLDPTDVVVENGWFKSMSRWSATRPTSSPAIITTSRRCCSGTPTT